MFSFIFKNVGLLLMCIIFMKCFELFCFSATLFRIKILKLKAFKRLLCICKKNIYIWCGIRIWRVFMYQQRKFCTDVLQIWYIYSFLKEPGQVHWSKESNLVLKAFSQKVCLWNLISSTVVGTTFSKIVGPFVIFQFIWLYIMKKNVFRLITVCCFI